LGVNSSMIGFGVFGGALTAGFVAITINYTMTFVTSSIVLLGSAALFRFYLNHRLSEKTIH
jgi:predicted MFS family arabinose efflux permease